MDAAAHEAALDGLAGSLRERMLAQPPEPGGDDDARTRIRALVDREAGMLDEHAREALADRIAERSFGLGPLEPLLADPEVDEILVCGTAPAWVERGGRLEATAARFTTEAELRHAIERILAPLGRRVDEAEPLVDARLPDRTVGTRQSSPNVVVVIYRSKSLPSLGDLERPVDGYIRVSRVGDRSGESYISPDVQRRALESWAAERGIELAMHEPEENVSGATMDRPIFNRIMRRIRARESGGIVVYKLDRFARTLVGGLTTLNELTDHRALFASATEPLFDFTTADGRIFLQINLMMAEYFRERTREGWETSLTYAVARGVHIAPDVPYGYVKDDDKRLVPDPVRAPVVLRAYERRVEGWPYQRIADWLNEHAPARADGREWVARTVEHIVQKRPVTLRLHAERPLVAAGPRRRTERAHAAGFRPRRVRAAAHARGPALERLRDPARGPALRGEQLQPVRGQPGGRAGDRAVHARHRRRDRPERSLRRGARDRRAGASDA